MAILSKRQLPFLIIIASVCLMVAQAQSGRRSTGGPTTTTTSTPSATGAKTVDKKPAEPKVQLLVGMNRTGAFTPTPFYIYDTVLDVCIRRLSAADIVFATAASANLSRSEAIKAAKQETTRWVVSLEIHSFYAEAGRQVNAEQDELYVDYAVIEPVTGKIKRSGRTRQHIYQNKRGEITVPPRPGAGYSEYSIRQAALEAADKILAGFDITVRP